VAVALPATQSRSGPACDAAVGCKPADERRSIPLQKRRRRPRRAQMMLLAVMLGGLAARCAGARAAGAAHV